MNNEDYAINLAIEVRNGTKDIFDIILLVQDDAKLLEILIDCWYRFKYWDIIDLLLLEKSRMFLEYCYLLECENIDH